MAERLNGKIAVVTGASRGMGEAIARQFAAEGSKVIMMARSADELERAAGAIGTLGGYYLKSPQAPNSSWSLTK